MVGGFPSENGPRALGRPGDSASHQPSGDQSDLPCPTSLPASSRGQTSPHSIGQRHGRGVHKPSGRYSQQASNDRSGKDSALGRALCSGDLRRPHSRGGKLGSRFSKSPGPSICFSVSFSIPSILGFLQSGLGAGLSLSTLKGQVSALSILFQRDLAPLPQVITFLQGVAHVAPHHSLIDPWDLNLVLGTLQKVPFEPIQDIPLSLLSWKVTFLIAITSFRRVSELAAFSLPNPPSG
ncbi:uncharacterized protein [Dendrobates tinctorius]|uniref:uncharacterized protein n=1 Tax=Dendrobates tinctorius TaxID=92724 RepID=UPI003CCA641E